MNTNATNNVAVSSAATRVSSSTAMYLGTSASTDCNGGDGSPAELASSLAPARETRSSAVSALAHSPANRASTAAARISQPKEDLPRLRRFGPILTRDGLFMHRALRQRAPGHRNPRHRSPRHHVLASR